VSNTAEQIERLTFELRRGSQTHRDLERNVGAALRAAQYRHGGSARSDGPAVYRRSSLTSAISIATFVGMKMDETVALLGAVTDEVKKAKEELEDVKNQAFAVSDVLLPEMLSHVKRLREVRMSVTDEMRQSLQALRDVRMFFMESDYAVEVARLERFVALCRELQELKRDGTLDALCDSALRLATK
jgi:hypothetical protein